MFNTVKSCLNENIRPINKQQNESEHPLECKQTDKNLNKIRKSIGRKGLLICSLNAPSLVKHKDELEVLVVENKIDIIAINETKLENNIDNSWVALNDFSLLRCDRNRHRGGVAMYVRETIDFEHRTDLQTDNLEILCIEVKPKFSKSFLALAWYRPPKYEHETLNALETLLKTIENKNDLNIDDKNKVIDHLRSVYRQFQMKQLIKFPTRSTLTSQTLIDHFASNKPSYIIDSGVFTTGFSDHDLIYGVRKVSSRINREPKIIKSRQLKNYDPTKFRKELQQVDWESIIELNDVNAMSLEWEKEFIRVLDKHGPIRKRKVRDSYAPYIDKKLKHKMFMRDLYKKRFSKTKKRRRLEIVSRL